MQTEELNQDSIQLRLQQLRQEAEDILKLHEGVVPKSQSQYQSAYNNGNDKLQQLIQPPNINFSDALTQLEQAKRTVNEQKAKMVKTKLEIERLLNSETFNDHMTQEIDQVEFQLDNLDARIQAELDNQQE